MSQQKQSKIKPKLFQMDLDSETTEIYLQDTHLSIDCEMMGLNPRRDRLCLVQLCDSANHFSVVQILNGQKEAPNLKKLFEKKEITKIFHFARMDMIFINMYLGIRVAPVFCTKIASKISRTYTDKHSLRELIREFFDINIDKKNQSSDWGKKILSKEQLEYACEDVRYLISLQNLLTEILIRENRMDLAQNCFEFLPSLIELDKLELKEIFEH
jgi:ribonuclease D